MLRSSRSRNFFRKLVVNGVSNSKAAIQNDCLMRLYDADAELKAISSELDSFDGKKDPIRCNLLVNQLRTAQDKVISLLFQLMDDCNCERASRDYRMKFPDEILLSEGSESLNGQIWFGAECLSAGSNILNHTKESTMLRPMAKTLTTHLDSLRNDLRALVIDGGGASRINQALIKKMVAFDHIFATFEYEYVRTMLPIRTVAEIEKLQEVAVLFSETLIDCVKRGLIKQDDIDEFQPIVMIAIPRLAIVRGLLYRNENPIYTRHRSQMCSLFQPFHGPLHSIRKLLRGLSPMELFSLEKMLANDQTAIESPMVQPKLEVPDKNQENVDDTVQSNEERSDNSCRSEAGENEAGTSNNYTNMLMDGLQYPVGQKRGIQDSNDDIDEQNSHQDCCFGASSSKSIVAPQSHENSPVGSSSSSISSSLDCKKCDSKNASNQVECERKKTSNNSDNNCCLSPQDSDAQLEKLIADFDPSMNDNNRNSHVEDSNDTAKTTETDTSTATTIDAPSASKDTAKHQIDQVSKVDPANEDEALLEELFMKQAQQLLHRLFVAISGVADQLQSNFASDLRFILRHIFSSEIEGGQEDENDNDNDNDDNDDDGESDSREYSNNEQSDSSLPIEQGIEAQEVANLIDLESDYSLACQNEYDYDYHIPYTPPANRNRSYLISTTNQSGEVSRYSPNSSLYAPTTTTHHHQQHQQQSISTENIQQQARQYQNASLNREATNEEMFANLMNTVDQSELMYESRTSPNDTSIMDDSRHRQQLLQQHIQQTIARGPRSSSRSHRHGSDGNNVIGSQLERVERRPRHHGHRGSRSRRARGPPHWVPDNLVVACSCCNATFTWLRRRHHCRLCGQIFCSDCSKFTKTLNCWGYNGPQRVCEECFNEP